MRNFKIERTGVVRDERGMKVGTVQRNTLRDARGSRLAEISGDRIKDSRGLTLGEISGSRIKTRRGNTVMEIDKIPLDYEMPVSPEMAAAIMHFFIKPIFD